MDLFTHILVAYLLSFGLVGFQPAYLAAGALAGGLPDADAFFFPLARRFPMLRHHGLTHSIFGVTIVAVAGAILAPRLAPGNPLLYFAVMEVAGLAHIALDGFTHFSVPPLLPFSDRRLELDADRAINFVTLIVSVLSFYLLLGVERGHVPFSLYLLTVYVLAGFYASYFGLRLVGRLWVRRVLRRHPEFTVPVPTGSPFTWLLLAEKRTGQRLRTSFARYRLGHGFVLGPLTVDVPLATGGAPGGVVRSAEEALARSYPLMREASPFLDQSYVFAEARDEGSAGWVATWYSLEFSAFGRSAAVRVRFPPDGGAPAVKSAWHTPLWRRELT